LEDNGVSRRPAVDRAASLTPSRNKQEILVSRTVTVCLLAVAILVFSGLSDSTSRLLFGQETESEKETPKPSNDADNVTIPDKNLETVLREILKKKQIEKEQITEEDLRQIYFLEADDRNIEDLTGLKHCTNLALVRLAKNGIQNVEPLSHCLNIQSLDLHYNRIEDIAPLGKLKKLQYLQLEHNKIENIEAVKELKAMNSLYLSDNRVSDVSAVSGLSKIWSLYLADNKVENISPIANLKGLSNLDLEGNAVKDVSPLEGLTELSWTFLNRNQVEDIAPLVRMADKDNSGDKRFAPYWNLYLGENPLDEESQSQHLAELKKIGVRLNMD
jgi:Leucine-rich repeat (LRR) protein